MSSGQKPSFKKYNQIKLLTDEKVTKYLTDNVKNEPWVVTEKIHGCNLSLIITQNSILIARRNDIMSNEESKKFHQANKIVERYESVLRDLYNEYSTDKIIIYGELFGGSYPGYRCIDGNVFGFPYYSNKIDFCAFDICMIDKHHVIDKFLPYSEQIIIFEKIKMLYAKPLFIGTFEESVKFSEENMDIETTIPALLGLSQIEINNQYRKNIREGHVLKPLVDSYFEPFGSRIIFKHKHPAFDEERLQPSINIKQVKKQDLSSAKYDFQPFINNSRLESVISKLMPDAKFIEVLNEFTVDVMNSYELTIGIIEDKHLADKTIKKLASKLISKYYKSKN